MGCCSSARPEQEKLTSDAQFSQRRFGKAKPHFYDRRKNALEDKTAWVAGAAVSQDELVKRFTEVEILVLDEIGAYRSPHRTRKGPAFEIVNERYEQMHSTIFISNLQLSGRDSIDKYLEERIMDRICEQAQVLICNWESYRRELMNEKLLSEPKNSRQKSYG